MAIPKKTVKLDDQQEKTDEAEESPSNEDFNTHGGTGGSGTGPNAATHAQTRGQYWKDVQADLNRQAKASEKGKQPDNFHKGKSGPHDIKPKKAKRSRGIKAKKS
jgi:hypothetical protein